jgi:hypothetical protein
MGRAFRNKNAILILSLFGLYSADSELAGAHGDPPRQTTRAL